MQETQVQSLAWEDPLEKEWQPTLVFLPGEFPGQRSLVTESDTTERLTHTHILSKGRQFLPRFLWIFVCHGVAPKSLELSSKISITKVQVSLRSNPDLEDSSLDISITFNSSLKCLLFSTPIFFSNYIDFSKLQYPSELPFKYEQQKLSLKGKNKSSMLQQYAWFPAPHPPQTFCKRKTGIRRKVKTAWWNDGILKSKQPLPFQEIKVIILSVHYSPCLKTR